MQQLSKLFNANIVIIHVVLKLGLTARKKCFVILLLRKKTLATKHQQGKLREYLLASFFGGAFAKLRKATISFVMAVRPSVRP